jgi:spermidine/putrescine transport system permease protein
MSRLVLRCCLLLGYGLLFAPIAVIVLFSFNDPAGRFNLVWRQPTAANWLDPLSDPGLTGAFITSLLLALAASAVATVLGSLMAYALVRYRCRGERVVNLLLVLLLTTPEVVMGVSLLNLFVQLGVQRGLGTLLVSHSLFCLSFVALTVKARLGGIDWNLEDAAMDLGARPGRVFRLITLPRILPGVLAAALLSFSLSLDDVIVSSFTAGEAVTFPLYIAGAFQREISPQIHVLATVVLVASVAMLAAGSLRQLGVSSRFRAPASSARGSGSSG